ncbi:MAG: transglutaminase domain-containing protein [Bacteroidales bacterium]|nr:transglutaminase domain-containing protein [Bacteroidales bacterium]
MKKINILYLLMFLVLIMSSCNVSKNPDNVEAILKKSGKNRSQLEAVIEHYKNSDDTLKIKAAYFLIGNMCEHSYVTFKMVDTASNTVDWDVLKYKNYQEVVKAWDSIENVIGPIHFVIDKKIMDYDTITSDFLIKNIDLAFKAWRDFPWSRHLNFDQFCEYILPYRGSNEPLENWREYFYNNFNWVVDSMKGSSDPIKAACLINDNIKSWFRFDSRYYEHPTDQGFSEMLKNKMGRCEDMTNLAIFAFRAMGVPVMSDYTPYWAKTGNNHAWNATLDSVGKVVIFMGGEANPGKYNLHHVFAKVYRKTFAKQLSSLKEKNKNNNEKLPPYLRHNTYSDVTKDYVSAFDIKMKLKKTKTDTNDFAYICVFNTGEWRAIHWSEINNDEVIFTDMGTDIVYLPAYFIDKKIKPAGNPFIFDKNAKINTIIPDTLNLRSIKVFGTTASETKETTDFITKVSFKKNKNYTLYYWYDKWIKIGEKKSKGKALIFKDVPSNALYWLKAEDSHNEERIFTIDKSGKQIWW